MCSALLKRCRSKDDFLVHLVTVDETWVNYYEPENKAQSHQWVEAKEVQDIAICWQGDGHSILGCKRHYYVGLFTKEKHNNWSVLCKLSSEQLRTAIREKCRGKRSKGVLLQHDNARVHTCKVAIDVVERKE